MTTLTLFARNVARQSLGKAVRLNAGAHFSAIRFSSTYFTPGTLMGLKEVIFGCMAMQC